MRFWFGVMRNVAVVALRDLAQRRSICWRRRPSSDAGRSATKSVRWLRAVLALGPAVAVAGRGERERLGGAELHARALLHLGAEGIEAAVLDGVFEPRVLAIRPVAPVALHRDDRLGDRERHRRVVQKPITSAVRG